jgi:hypothetical protein
MSCVYKETCGHEICGLDMDWTCPDFKEDEESEDRQCCKSGQTVTHLGHQYCVRCKKPIFVLPI